MMYNNEPLKIYITKICHHIMASCGTFYSVTAPLHSCYFYITEIVNLPIELRFVVIEHNYKKILFRRNSFILNLYLILLHENI